MNHAELPATCAFTCFLLTALLIQCLSPSCLLLACDRILCLSPKWLLWYCCSTKKGRRLLHENARIARLQDMAAQRRGNNREAKILWLQRGRPSKSYPVSPASPGQASERPSERRILGCQLARSSRRSIRTILSLVPLATSTAGSARSCLLETTLWANGAGLVWCLAVRLRELALTGLAVSRNLPSRREYRPLV